MKTLLAEMQSYMLCGGWTDETRVIPGEPLIPAVQGEFYAYSARFTRDKPLYVLAKCKSNKARTLASLSTLGQEASLLFRPGSSDYKQVCSPMEAYDLGLLEGSARRDQFRETWVGHTSIGTAEFHSFHSLERLQDMVDLCTTACSERNEHVDMKPGSVIAMTTDTGKYGLFLVKRLTHDSVLIDACHILL
jgi:hypothetical protein